MSAERLALAFPGQGGNWGDLLTILEEHAGDPLVARLSEVVGADDLASLDGTDTGVAQPCLFVASLLSARASGDDPDPVAAVGHSMGEVTALAYAGALSDEAGLALVAERARLGAAAQVRREGRMVAVMRLTDPEVEWLRRRTLAEVDGVLELAVRNGARQSVLAGDAAAVDHLVEVAEQEGAVARRLPIGGAFHSPLLVDSVEPYRAAVEAAGPADPEVPVVLSTAAEVVASADDVVRLLPRALVLPVRWLESLRTLAALPVDRVVDVGPGQTLANLAEHDLVLPFTARRERRGARR